MKAFFHLLPSPLGTPLPNVLPSPSHRWRLAGLIALSFALFATLHFPIPGVNEPHYLTKARHFWEPEWCHRDAFLQSADAHVVFYATVGALTQWLTFEEAAWIGRVLGWLLLAGGWSELVLRLVPGRWAPLWSAWIFLGLASIGNFSGEWVVGGVEAKVFTYGFLFWSLAWLLSDRLILAAAASGLAVSFHPVVGGWSLIALAFALGWSLVSSWWRSSARTLDAALGGLPFTVRPLATRLLLPGAVLILCMLPGLVPALQMLGEASPQLTARANQIHVFVRLKHHLDPTRFPLAAYVGYAALIAGWLILRRWSRKHAGEKFFALYVGGSILVALAGLVIGFGPRTASLMKFYPFRLADALVPLAFSITLAGLLEQLAGRSKETQPTGFTAAWRGGMAWGIAVMTLAFAIASPMTPRSRWRETREAADWIDVNTWVRENTPADALFWATRRREWAFRWYAQRAQYVSYKDCPQDAAGIVDWYERQWTLHRWSRAHFDAGYSAHALAELRETTGIDHLIARRDERMEAKPLYQNSTFVVYKLP